MSEPKVYELTPEQAEALKARLLAYGHKNPLACRERHLLWLKGGDKLIHAVHRTNPIGELVVTSRSSVDDSLLSSLEVTQSYKVEDALKFLGSILGYPSFEIEAETHTYPMGSLVVKLRDLKGFGHELVLKQAVGYFDARAGHHIVDNAVSWFLRDYGLEDLVEIKHSLAFRAEAYVLAELEKLGAEGPA